MRVRSILALSIALPFALAHHSHHYADDSSVTSQQQLSINGIPDSTRAYWMRKANAALLEVTGSNCPFGAFGSVIVNHTVTGPDGLGEIVCMGANSNRQTGDPTMHGRLLSTGCAFKFTTDCSRRRDCHDTKLQRKTY